MRNLCLVCRFKSLRTQEGNLLSYNAQFLRAVPFQTNYNWGSKFLLFFLLTHIPSFNPSFLLTFTVSRALYKGPQSHCPKVNLSHHWNYFLLWQQDSEKWLAISSHMGKKNGNTYKRNLSKKEVNYLFANQSNPLSFNLLLNLPLTYAQHRHNFYSRTHFRKQSILVVIFTKLETKERQFITQQVILQFDI